MWVDAENKFLTQRPNESRQGNGGQGLPAMSTIRAGYEDDGSTLRLEATGLEPLVVSASSPSASSRRECTLFSGQAKVVDVDEVSGSTGEWFARFCGLAGACLVRSDATSLAEDWRASRVAFQSKAFEGEEAAPRQVPLDDGGTILIASQASLDELNQRLAGKSLPAVTMSRFRPNFVIGGLSAHEEDEWLQVQLGEVRFRVERPCTRCSTVLVDQDTGTSDETNWLSTVLARYRLSKPDGAYGGFDLQGTKFGVYCTPLNAGLVRETDEVVVLQVKPAK